MWQDGVALIFGGISTGMGLAFFFSPTFGNVAYNATTEGNLWKGLVGDKWAPLVAKYLFSLAGIAFGAWLIYLAIWGPHRY